MIINIKHILNIKFKIRDSIEISLRKSINDLVFDSTYNSIWRMVRIPNMSSANLLIIAIHKKSIHEKSSYNTKQRKLILKEFTK